ncbi:MAG: DUF1127 domain-containing protein [Sedimenticola sp.]
MNKPFEQLKLSSVLRSLQASQNIRVATKLINKLDDYAEQYAEYRLSKKAIRELGELDNRMLKDIGIDRADVTRIAMADNPRCELEKDKG